MALKLGELSTVLSADDKPLQEALDAAEQRSGEVADSIEGDAQRQAVAFSSAAEKTKTSLDKGSKAADEHGSHLGAMGEKADGAETSIIGVHDVIDGTATIMQGPGKQGIVSYLQGWADVAGGIAPLLLQLGTLKLATIQQTIAQWAQNAAWLASPITWIVAGIALVIAAVVLIATKTDWFQKGWSAAWGGIKAGAQAVANWFSGPFAHFFVAAFDDVKGIVVGYYHFWVDTWGKIIGFVAGVPGKIGRAAHGMFDGIVAAYRTAINWIIKRWNDFHLTLGGGSILGMDIPSVTLNTPNIPLLGDGGIVPATPGGRLVRVAERGEAEAIAPLSKLGGRVELEIVSGGDAVIEALLRILRDHIRARYRGDVDLAMGTT